MNPRPSRLDRLPPALPRLHQDLVSAPPQRPRQRDRGERMPGVSERRHQEPPRPHCNPRCAPPPLARGRLARRAIPSPDATPGPRPRRAPALRRRGAAAPRPGGDASRHRLQPDHRRRLRRSRRRHLPDARRAPKRRPHQPRQLRPRVGPLHRCQAPPPRDPPRAAHAAHAARVEPRRRRPRRSAARSPRRPPGSAPSAPRSQRATALPAEVPRPDTGERHRARELRDRLHWSWMRPARRYEEYRDLLAAAEEQLAEQRAAELLEDRPAEHLA